MDSAQLIKAFAATVQASSHGLSCLEPVLQCEQKLLTGNDPAMLDQVVAEKLELLRQLEYSVQARERLQKVAGVPAGLDGGGQLVETLNQPTLSADWQTLCGLARRVAKLNDRNGQLAVQGQHATRTALGILTGRGSEEDTYSALKRKRGGNGYILGRV